MWTCTNIPLGPRGRQNAKSRNSQAKLGDIEKLAKPSRYVRSVRWDDDRRQYNAVIDQKTLGVARRETLPASDTLMGTLRAKASFRRCTEVAKAKDRMAACMDRQSTIHCCPFKNIISSVNAWYNPLVNCPGGHKKFWGLVKRLCGMDLKSNKYHN
ncbi:uncharacterized protein CIMG_13774 [Coccidioides immitis RS]|uniref:Uncharacterized protein n=1 Tax=Coccidioides immitis (strain RS) TaxID=246410 RepID=A0A0D8JZF1_COCIM|nr:uncharacterized protein CIMG_13774 [Coccidioides immitis RS]KJF61613.1 hypothetical protein CIMG_13774 [Coccidioides immitis RS]